MWREPEFGQEMNHQSGGAGMGETTSHQPPHPENKNIKTLHHRSNIRLTTPGMKFSIRLADNSKRGFKNYQSAFVLLSVGPVSEIGTLINVFFFPSGI